jgi:Na+/melibiose symporter-like transporter
MLFYIKSVSLLKGFIKRIIFRNIVLSSTEKKTFRLHFLYYAIEGIILGILALNEFVFIKSLKGSNIQVGVLFQFSVIVLIFSIFFNEWIKRIGDKKKLLRIVGIITRLPLMILLFFPKNLSQIEGNSMYHIIFLTIFLIYYFANPIVYPIINLFLKRNYSHRNFGRLFSYATTFNKIIMLVVTFAYGLLLDVCDHAYIYVFPVVAVLGIFSIYLLSLIDYDEQFIEIPRRKFIRSLKQTINNMQQIMKTNKAFRDFETGFMFYGFAFMGTVSVITIFFEKGLHLNYSTVAFYKNAYNILAILILPFFGKLIGKIDPRKFAAITFASLLFYLFFMGLTEYFPLYTEIWGIKIYLMLMLSIISNGVFAATMALLWSIGSVYFCKAEDAANYQSIHLTFTGLRSFFAPLLGVLFYELWGFTWTFAIGIGFLAIAIILMLVSMKKETIILQTTPDYKQNEMSDRNI